MSSTAIRILHCVLQHRRSIPVEQENQLLYLPSHLQKINFLLERQQPIHFVLPAFPAKSPNSQKVLGKLPDMGERVSLELLQSLCNQIQEIYAPGAKITICSDGRVFSDLVSVSDEDVTAYGQEIKNIISEIEANSLDLFNMEDVFNEHSFSDMRQRLAKEYATSIEELRSLVKTDSNHRNLFNGIHRFLVEDYKVLQPDKSRNKVRSECKEIAYHVIQRSNAWSNLVAARFPQSLRLSIHPQPRDSEKIGIHMIKTEDSWGTPWHNVAVHDGKEFRLMKRSQAEIMGGSLVYNNGRPSHYKLVGFIERTTAA